jgi:hypothetical protein
MKPEAIGLNVGTVVRKASTDYMHSEQARAAARWWQNHSDPIADELGNGRRRVGSVARESLGGTAALREQDCNRLAARGADGTGLRRVAGLNCFGFGDSKAPEVANLRKYGRAL